MNTSVNIGCSQDFRLSHALLVYGRSSYDGFPYRHPFVTLHDVIHEAEGVRMAEGRLLTPQMLVSLIAGLGHSLPVEILPERLLVRTETALVWWRPAQQARLFFSQTSADPMLKKLNGKLFPHPPLVFKAAGKHLWVRALYRNERPTAETRLYVAPYWNCYDNAAVCTGSMRLPEERSVSVIGQWEESFFRSEFTHGAGVRRHTRHQDGLVRMWHSLAGKNKFPAQYLVRSRQNLAEFVTSDDSTYRNGD
jgi:PRTRC genetic system protein B